MFYKADFDLSYDLIKLPESGLGYQFLSGMRKDGYRDDLFIVYNAELIVPFDDEFYESKRELLSEGFTRAVKDAAYLRFQKYNLVPRSFLKESRVLTESKKRDNKRHSGGKGAIDNPLEPADGREIFVRLSAYENDRRIDFQSKRLKPGTYSTTNKDYMDCVSYVDDPVDRYALPNDETIKWAFYIQPKVNDTLQRGIVQPAFGHDGGGIEVYFANGTSVSTYLDKSPYGK